jgi:hypothetical protein
MSRRSKSASSPDSLPGNAAAKAAMPICSMKIANKQQKWLLAGAIALECFWLVYLIFLVIIK